MPLFKSLFARALCFFAALPVLAADFPPVRFLGDPANHGRNIQRTMRLLAESTAEAPNTVRVLFYGQSITEQGWWKIVADDLRARFPHASLVIDNRALGGFASQMLVRCVESDVVSFQPDLLIFHVFGAHDKYEDIIRTVRERTCAEILIQGDHLNAKGDWRGEETDPAKVTTKNWSSFMNYKHLPAMVAKYGTGFVDQRAVWKRYLTDHGLEPQALLKDNVHLNPHGEWLMAECVKPHLVRRADLGDATADDWVKTINAAEPWKAGKLRLEFEGSRVDVIVGSSGGSGPLTFLIDGKKPSEWPELHAFTRALSKPGGKWPVIAPVRSEKPLLLEQWTLQAQRDAANGKHFTFSVAGSATGPDGAGRSDAHFVSKSGRIAITPEDWNVGYALGLAQVKPVPDKFTVTWQVEARFTDELRFLVIPPNDRLPPQPQRDSAVIIANGLPNTRHVLEIAGDAAAPIRSVRVCRPPLGRK